MYPHNNLALLLVKLDKLDEAEAEYKKALAIYPEYVDANNNYAMLLRKLGKDGQAEIFLKKALGIS